MEKKLRPLSEIDQLREDFVGAAPSKAKAMERSLLLSSNFGSAEARAEMDRQLQTFVAEKKGQPAKEQPKDIWELMSPQEQIASLKSKVTTLEKNMLVKDAEEDKDNTGAIALGTAELCRYDIDRIEGFGLTSVFRQGKNIALWTKNPFVSTYISCRMLRDNAWPGYFYDPNKIIGTSPNPMGDLRTKDYFLWEEDTSFPTPYNSDFSDRITILQNGVYALFIDGGCWYSTSTPGHLFRLAQTFNVTPQLYDSTGSEIIALGTAQGEFHKYCRMPRLPLQSSGDFGLNQIFEVSGNYGPYQIRLESYGTYVGSTTGEPVEDEVSIYLGHDHNGDLEYETYDSVWYNFVFGGQISVIKIA
jgi:hypothetical protein